MLKHTQKALQISIGGNGLNAFVVEKQHRHGLFSQGIGLFGKALDLHTKIGIHLLPPGCDGFYYQAFWATFQKTPQCFQIRTL
ncbi:Uncharacterised protein [Vibrio cholerae]|nr:Uncharacterised protein [Vibrio cholerae]